MQALSIRKSIHNGFKFSHIRSYSILSISLTLNVTSTAPLISSNISALYYIQRKNYYCKASEGRSN